MSPSNAESLRGSLKAATNRIHDRMEESAYYRALNEGHLPLASYVTQLRIMAVVHATLERLLEASQNKALRAVWRSEMGQMDDLRHDLAFFQKHVPRDIPEAVSEALELSSRLRVWSEMMPESLLGPLYVIMGARMGACILRPKFERQFKLSDGEGLSYFSRASDPSRIDLTDFWNRLNAAPLSADQRTRVVAAAVETFEFFDRIFQRLYPIDETARRPTAISLNPEAGDHPVPEEPAVIEAALRAGQRCFDHFPYLGARYAERGRAFTASDSAWLVCMATESVDAAIRQVLWLGRVLAARGLPRLILETHLRMLHEDLLTAFPNDRARYAGLLAAADALRAARQEVLGDAPFQRLSNEFDEKVRNMTAIGNFGALLLSAVADEAAGIHGMPESLTQWITAGTRFPPHWIEAATAVVEEARATATGSSS